MKIFVFPTHCSVKEGEVEGKIAVVVDVFRATTTILTALSNGCSEVVPVTDVKAALAVAKRYTRGQVLLGGERNAKKIPSFDLSNSPSEYNCDQVKNSTIVFTTTNGTEAIAKVSLADKVVIGAFVNAVYVAEYLVGLNQDTAIVCAGTENKFSMEDLLAAGAIISGIKRFGVHCELDDLGVAALSLYCLAEGDLKGYLKDTSHFKTLLSEGLERDIDDCLSVNTIPIIGYIANGIIKKINT